MWEEVKETTVCHSKMCLFDMKIIYTEKQEAENPENLPLFYP